jgi:hypothetical protein
MLFLTLQVDRKDESQEPRKKRGSGANAVAHDDGRLFQVSYPDLAQPVGCRLGTGPVERSTRITKAAGRPPGRWSPELGHFHSAQLPLLNHLRGVGGLIGLLVPGRRPLGRFFVGIIVEDSPPGNRLLSGSLPSDCTLEVSDPASCYLASRLENDLDAVVFLVSKRLVGRRGLFER